MKKITFAFAVAMALMSFGCKKKGGTDAAEAMKKMGEFKTEMCNCKDAKCAQDVSDKMMKWSQEASKNQKEPPKMSEADQKAAAALGEEMAKCMQTAMGAGMGAGSAEAGSAEAGSAEAGSAAAGSAEAGSAAAGSAAAGSAAAGSAAPAGSAAAPEKK